MGEAIQDVGKFDITTPTVAGSQIESKKKRRIFLIDFSKKDLPL